MKKTQIVFNTLTIILTCFALCVTFNIPKGIGNTLKPLYSSKRSFKIMNSLLIKKPIEEDKSFVVVITSYNNQTFCEKNLFSVFQQTYKNYRVIYIDDCSSDATFEKAQAFTKALNQEGRISFTRNPVRNQKLANLYPAYMSCKDDEIIVCLDGDDWFAHENVLKELNEYYQNPNVWITYGSAINHPKYEKRDGRFITDQILLTNSIREKKFFLSMVRSFYAGLFKQIKLKDLLYEGRFLLSADDFAFMIPMVEMAPTHTLFIPEILYVINDANLHREHITIGDLQEKLTVYLKSKEKYTPLDPSFNPRNLDSELLNQSLDLIVLSNGDVNSLHKALKNYLSHVSPLRNIYVLFNSSSLKNINEYDFLLKEFPSVSFIHESELSLKSLIETSSAYVAIASDNLELNRQLDLSLCVKELELTGSINFLIGTEPPYPDLVKLNNSVVAASFETIVKSNNLSNNRFFSIFQKNFLLKNLIPNKSAFNAVYDKNKNRSETTLFFLDPL